MNEMIDDNEQMNERESEQAHKRKPYHMDGMWKGKARSTESPISSMQLCMGMMKGR